MSHKLFHICSIIAENSEDYKVLSEYLGGYPVHLSQQFPEENYFDIPTLLVGWNSVKHRFVSQNITDKKVLNNLFWTFSKAESEKDFLKNVEDFFADSVKKWLPGKYHLYDSYLNQETLTDFLDKKINKDKKLFVYFHDGAMYIFNDGNNFVINIKSLVIKERNFRSILTDIMNSNQTVVFSYNNIGGYVHLNLLNKITVIDSLRWVRFGVETMDNYFSIIPNFAIEKYIPFLMSKINPIELDAYQQAFYDRMLKRDEITYWLSNREIAFNPTYENNRIDFKIRKNHKLAKVNYSNKRTITGRITSKDSAYNPQNLDKHNDDRKNIISRFENGNILVLDYISFETKIALYISDDEDFIRDYYDQDLHFETACVLYETQDITAEQRDFSKILNHSLLYGAGEDTLIQKLSTQFSNPYDKLSKIKELLKPIIAKSEEIKTFYQKHGFLTMPTGSLIYPEKAHASFNNYIQAYAAEIVVDKLFEIRDFLKSYKTEFLFQVHDSLVFDLHPSEHFLIERLCKRLSQHKNMFFGINYSMGPNYKELKELYGTISE